MGHSRKIRNYNGRYCEAEYEAVVIASLEASGWEYTSGPEVGRKTFRDVLIEEDCINFLRESQQDLEEDEIRGIYNSLALIGRESEFSTLHAVYNYLTDGMQFVPSNGKARMVHFIDYEHPEKNTFRVVNQLEVEYTPKAYGEDEETSEKNEGGKPIRIPDILLYVNGFPLCIIELKNPASRSAKNLDAWEQIYIRYWRDIPHLLHYCPLACISDGAQTKLGTVRTPYEHFYAWRRIHDNTPIAKTSFSQLQTMVQGVYEPTRFLEIFRDYIYFQDEQYDHEEREIVCRYPQFFASRRLKASIIDSVVEGSGKGGTYFGATGCGKTYTMAFLARQLALRCHHVPEIGSPTIILIVDRMELQKQGAKLFMKSQEFLSLGAVSVVQNRAELRQELGLRQSGGLYICTIQKFCDREDDVIGLINDRRNIICFSDEAHRTQLEHSRKIQFSKDGDENMRAMLSKPYAKVLREAFPNATFVGFTGTPIAETYQTFGDEIDRYTMDQAVEDGLTVSIKYHPRIAKVFLDQGKAKEIEEYYLKCADEGATPEDIEASKRAMSSMEVILGEPSRLERLAKDIYEHYTKAIETDTERVQKAMIVCSNRKIAYALLKTFEKLYPDWFELKKTPCDAKVAARDLRRLTPLPTIAMIASVGKNDPEDMYNYLGSVKNDKRSEDMANAFKDDLSNFRIAIVVDMWITGFDVPSLTYLYNDKPLKKHLLIQTISRVNRVYPGKEFGMVIDYIGIRKQMRQAMKTYGGDTSVAPTADDVEQATMLFREELAVLKHLFRAYDLTPFIDTQTDPIKRHKTLTLAAEYVFASTEELTTEGKKKIAKVSFKTYFFKTVKRMRLAYDICQPSGELGEEESALAQCFMAIAGLVRKMNGTSDIDTDVMNRRVAAMVEEALQYTQVEDVFVDGSVEDLFSPEYLETLSNIKMPATKLELLIKMLRRQIREYSRVNDMAARTFLEMLEGTIAEYHERRKHLEEEEATEVQQQAIDDIIENAMSQALKILHDMKESRDSFRKLGLTFEEKAFYDILLALRDQYNFEYGEDKEVDGIVVNDKCKDLARKIKDIIDEKSSFVDWLNNRNIQADLKLSIKICLVKNGYPPQYSPEVFKKVMRQVENFKEHHAGPPQEGSTYRDLYQAKTEIMDKQVADDSKINKL